MDDKFIELVEDYYIKTKYIRSVKTLSSDRLNPLTKQIETCRILEICVESNSGVEFFEIDEFSKLFLPFLFYFERSLI